MEDQVIIKDHTTTYREVGRGEKIKQRYWSKRFLGKLIGDIFTYIIIIGIAFVIIYPLIRRVGNAFKPPEEFFDSSVGYFPRNPSLSAIKLALEGLKLKTVLLPSVLLALYVGVAQTAIATIVGYGFARFKFKGSGLLFSLVILTLLVPPQIISAPLYLRFMFFDFAGIVKAITGESISILDTYFPQILLSTLGVGWKNGLYIYMMRQYFRGIPKELEEAAYIDGAKTFKAFFKIMLPSAVPMMMTVFLFSFSWQWTDTYYASNFMRNKITLSRVIREIATASVVEKEGYTAVSAFNTQQTAILLMILPLIVLFVMTQRFFVEGIERSGLTG